jgi:hypothetical protein
VFWQAVGHGYDRAAELALLDQIYVLLRLQRSCFSQQQKTDLQCSPAPSLWGSGR